MDQEIDLIEQARKAGQDYIDSFHGDLDAMTADLNARALEEARVTVTLPAKAPLPWQHSPTNSADSQKKAS